MALTNAERQRRFRAKRDADPQRRAEYIQSGKERYRKDAESGKQKPVSELNDREKRAIRKHWREQKRKDRLKLKKTKTTLQNVQTPPESPDEDQPSGSKGQNRKKKKKIEAKVYRDKRKLELEVQSLKKKLDVNRKRLSRSQEGTKTNATPRRRTKNLLRLLTPRETKRCLFKSQVILEAIRKKYKEKKKIEKASFSRFMCNYTLKKYKLKTETYKLVNCHSSETNPSKKYKTITKRLGNKIHSFYLRNDNSRLISGKRQTKTFRKERKQRRVLLHNLKTLHQKFVAEENETISYSAFCRLRPFYVTFPIQSDRNTCMCKTCNNTEIMAEALKRAKCFDTDNLEVLIEEVVCDMKRKECMYNECEICTDKCLNTDKSVMDEDVTWFEWKTKKEVRKIKRGDTSTEKAINIVVKEPQNGTVQSLFDKFDIQLKRYMKHLYSTCHQYNYFAKRKSNMKGDECLLHIDFSENYMCGYSSEIQSVHFGGSKKQLTLHTGVAYIKEKEPFSFCTVSDSLIHGPEAVWAHLQPIITDIRQNNPNITKIEIFSDGPVTQYRQKGNFFLASIKGHLNGFDDVTWSFFESGHGKEVPDAIGGAVKRQADSFVKYGGDIVSAETFCSAMSKESKVKMYVVEDKSISDVKVLLESVVLKPVPGTMSLHQVKCQVNSGEIAFRHLSCHYALDNEHEGHCFQRATIVVETEAERTAHNTPKTEQKVYETEDAKSSSRKEVHQDSTKVCNSYGNDRKRRINEILKAGMNKQAREMPQKNEPEIKIDEPRKFCENEESSIKEKCMRSNKYYQSLLLDLNKCKTFDELRNRVSIIPDLSLSENLQVKSIYRNQLEVDYDSLVDVPEDIGSPDLYPVKVNMDGNCLPSCGSVFAHGTPDKSEELRIQIIKDLCENEDYYLGSRNMERGLKDTQSYDIPSQFAQYSEYFLPGVHLNETLIRDIYRKEVMSLTKNKSYMGIWQIFALASILKTPIQSVYPDKGNPNVRRDLNRLIWPRTEPDSETIAILWTNTRDDIPREYLVSNHFVPLLPFDNGPEQFTSSQSSKDSTIDMNNDSLPTDINNNSSESDAKDVDNLKRMADKRKHDKIDTLTQLPEIDQCLNKYVILNFNGTPYPGFVQDIENGELEIVCMHKVGRKNDCNHFFWPQKMRDVAWYRHSYIITLIPDPLNSSPKLASLFD